MNLEELRQCYLDEEVPSIEDIYECDFTNVLEVFSSKEIKRATETGDESTDLFFQVKAYADSYIFCEKVRKLCYQRQSALAQANYKGLRDISKSHIPLFSQYYKLH